MISRINKDTITNPIMKRQAMIKKLTPNSNPEEQSIIEGLLEKVSYYKLIGYVKTIKKLGVSDSSAFFLDMIYLFDAKLRMITYYYIEQFEVSFSRHVLCLMTRGRKDPLPHLDESLFISNEDDIHDNRDRNQIEDDREYLRTVFSRVAPQEDSRNGSIPIWVLLDSIDFGTLACLFRSLRYDIQVEIMQLCNFSSHTSHISIFHSWLDNIRALRNRCVHNKRIFSYSVKLPPAEYKEEGSTIFKDLLYEGNIYYQVLFCLMNVLSEENALLLKKDIDDVIEKYLKDYSKEKELIVPYEWRNSYNKRYRF